MSTSDALRKVSLFTGMTDRSIDELSKLAEPASYGEGDLLAREGDPGETLILIVEGRARVDRAGRAIRDLGAGDFLGEISLIDGGIRTATVTALEPIEALVIERDGFARLMNEFPAVRLGLVEALANRIRDREPAFSD